MAVGNFLKLLSVLGGYAALKDLDEPHVMEEKELQKAEMMQRGKSLNSPAKIDFEAYQELPKEQKELLKKIREKYK